MEVHGPLWHTPLIVDSIAHSVNQARSDTTILKSRPDFLYANQALNLNEGIRTQETTPPEAPSSQF